MANEETGLVRKGSMAPAAPNRAQTLQAMAEVIRLEAETFGLSEGEIVHLKRAYWFAEVQNGLIPDAFKGDIRAIFIMSQIADRMKAGLDEVLQGGYFVHGRFGWYAEFLIKRVLVLGIFTAIDYETAGDPSKGTLTIRAIGTRPDGTKAHGTAVSQAMAKAEGWTRNPKYASMPALMLKKRAATFLIRECAPHITGGYQTGEELEDVKTQAEKGMVLESNPLDAMSALLAPDEAPDESQT